MSPTVPNVGQICVRLADLAPLTLAEDWDNVGLLLGQRSAAAQRIMTCLTIDDDVADEAIARQVGLVVTHHPLPFKPLAKITSDSPSGAIILKLLANQVAVYSAHTAFDSAASGINQLWAQRLGCHAIRPLIPATDGKLPATQSGSDNTQASLTAIPDALVGVGRAGDLPAPLSIDQLAILAGQVATAKQVRVVGNHSAIRRVGFACGSGGSFLSAAHAAKCQAMITGEATFHQCLEAKARGIALLLVGHYFSERFAMEQLAVTLQPWLAERWPDCQVFASQTETDPLRIIAVDDSFPIA